MPPRFAVAYARVSSEDQAKRDLSSPAQFSRMDNYAAQHEIQILCRDADEGFSSFKDNEHREAFWRLVDIACKDPRITLFLVDDPTRFFRDRYMAVETKSELRRHGVRVLAVSNPYDTETIAGVYMEAIDEARAQAGSMETAYHTRKGMEQNAQTRDQQTGWCFKNGGRAPFGYRAVHVARGQDHRGRDIVKTLWEIDEPAAEVLRFIYSRRAAGAGLKAIHRELCERGMPGPTPGRPWTISSVIELNREDRILQAAGVYFWNKEDHRTPGQRFKSREEWIRVDNAHPAIIDMETAQAVIARRQPGRGGAGPRTAGSPYLLTGKNAAGEDMFICTACGARMTCHKPARRSRPAYICGTVHYRDRRACAYKPIDKSWIEGYLLEQIRERYGSRERAEEIARTVNDAWAEEDTAAREAREDLERALKDVEARIDNLTRAVAAGYDAAAAGRILEPLRTEQERIRAALAEIEASKKESPPPVSAEEILQMYAGLEQAFQHQDIPAKRRLLRAFVRRIEFDPQADNLRIYLFAELSPDVCPSDGARDRSRYVGQTVLQAAYTKRSGR